MCLSAAISSSLGVLVACGPSSKVIAIYGPSTLTSKNAIFSVLGGFGVGEVAADGESCAATAAWADEMRIREYTKRRIITVTMIEQLKNRTRQCRKIPDAAQTAVRPRRSRCRRGVRRRYPAG